MICFTISTHIKLPRLRFSAITLRFTTSPTLLFFTVHHTFCDARLRPYAGAVVIHDGNYKNQSLESIIVLLSRQFIDSKNRTTMTMITISQPILKPPRVFLLIFFIILILSSLLTFPIDDGLRHVGVAFEGISHWADVYPFSHFSEYSELSPWYGYDSYSSEIISHIFSISRFEASTIKFSFCQIFITNLRVFSVFVPLIIEK